MPDQLGDLLGADDLSGVETAVDPDHGLALDRELAGFRFGQSLGQGQPGRDLLVAGEIPMVLGRRDDGHDHCPAFGCPSDIDHGHAVGELVQLFPIGDGLRVVDELIVVADVESEFLFGGRKLSLGRGRETQNGQQQNRDGDETAIPERHENLLEDV